LCFSIGDGKKEKDGKDKKGKKDEKEEKADELKPPRAISAYIYYSNDVVPKIKAELGISHKEAMGEAGKRWGTMTAADKKPYDALHDKDQERYNFTSNS
jgi:hypothetical protein